MKKIGLTLTFFVLVLLTLLTTLSIADDQTGAVSVTPNVGWYFFEGNQRLDDGITYGINLGYSINKNWDIEGSFNYVNSDRNDIGGDVDGFIYKLDGLYNITTFGKLVPYLAAGVGGITLNPDRGSAENDFLFNYGAGLKYFITDNIALRGDVRHVLPYGSLGKDESVNNLLCTVGISFLFGGEKEKPKVAETPKVEEPTQAEEPTKVEEPTQQTDSDGDGVYDDLDKCPDTPKGVEVDENGCPLDTDGDGVADYLDKCPNTPKGATVDEFGCWVCKGLNFDYNKWDIKPEYNSCLDESADYLKNANPDINVEIQGHTDNIGSRKFNLKLSEKRALAVWDYLINKGIAKERLTIKGFGFLNPVAPNGTEEGRSKNRRVQFKQLKE